jgi:hypothetical protein
VARDEVGAEALLSLHAQSHRDGSRGAPMPYEPSRYMARENQMNGFVRLLTNLAVFSIVTPRGGNAQPARASVDSATVADLEYRVESAMLRRNAAFLDSVYAPGFRFKHAGDRLQTREDIIQALRAPRPSALARDLDSLDVEIHGDVALTTGRIHVRTSSDDVALREYTVRYARVYVRRDGRWRLLTHHTTGQSTGPLHP